jgi:uncharacterized membrane protein
MPEKSTVQGVVSLSARQERLAEVAKLREKAQKKYKWQKIRERAALIGLGFGAVVLVLACTVGLFLAAVAALAWGVVDWHDSGLNFWALFYVILGGSILLAVIFNRQYLIKK